MIREKVPFLLMSIVFCVLTVLAQKKRGNIVSFEDIPLVGRLNNVVVSYVHYVEKTFIPTGLAYYYPLVRHQPMLKVLACLGFLIVLSWTVWRLRRYRPAALIGWLWFLGTLVPVIGLVQISNHMMGDRYSYFPLIGFFVGVVWLIPTIQKRSLHRIAAGIAIVTLGACAVASRQQMHFWRDSMTMARRAIAVTTNNFVAHYNLGCALHSATNLPEAAKEFRISLELNPQSADAHFNLGNVLAESGHPEEALVFYKKALELDSTIVGAHNNTGAILNERGETAAAEAEFRQAIQLDASFADAHSNYGNLLFGAGRFPEAEEQLRAAVALNPKDVNAHYLLARLQVRREPANAITNFKEAIRLRPKWMLPVRELAWMLATHPEAQFRNGNEALVMARALVKGSSPDAKTLDVLAAAEAETGDFAAAIATAQKAKELAMNTNPKLAESIGKRLETYRSNAAFRMQ
jgi:tetratricopeptide (TPR) repeat protein